ncbi:hypothetical protein DICVIV_07298 [Dictyocaulus viviparus]|uniref:Uncharacterized protein n=1 Tax=Dictyocaulus viviparus TaxID=29172 RepID=A0A0D8XSA4_DICVI|nr:hypothetical protein DICVIV_07298 [Dictyocaulus viviparus]
MSNRSCSLHGTSIVNVLIICALCFQNNFLNFCFTNFFNLIFLVLYINIQAYFVILSEDFLTVITIILLNVIVFRLE